MPPARKAFDPADICPAASIATAIRPADDGWQTGLFFRPCNAWACPSCGPRKRWELVQKIRAGNPCRFITLTCRPAGVRYPNPQVPDEWEASETPRDCWERHSRQVGRVWQRMTRRHGRQHYVRIVEATARGYPHFHFLTRGAFWPVADLRDEWERATGSNIVDMQYIGGGGHARRYVTKYVTKSDEVDWTRRRVSFSRHWLPPQTMPERTTSEWLGWKYARPGEARTWLAEHAGDGWRRIGRYSYVDGRRNPGEDLPPELEEWLTPRQPDAADAPPADPAGAE